MEQIKHAAIADFLNDFLSKKKEEKYNICIFLVGSKYKIMGRPKCGTSFISPNVSSSRFGTWPQPEATYTCCRSQPPERDLGCGNKEQGVFAGYATCDKANDAQWRYLKNYSCGLKKPPSRGWCQVRQDPGRWIAVHLSQNDYDQLILVYNSLCYYYSY